MTTPAQDAPLVLPSVAFRPVRLFLLCLALTAAAAGAGVAIGHLALGLFFGLGLGLGLLNAVMVQRSVDKITSSAHPLKSKVAINSASRLLIMTVVGLTIAFLFRPAGLGVVFGMALFQVLLVATTALPVMKALRRAATTAGEAEHD
ncbi:MAG TPA: ATP synthase subunit I [Mycobacterium sp.]|nr:ATP synthase subunit I [Mycobacterium sp.]